MKKRTITLLLGVAMVAPTLMAKEYHDAALLNAYGDIEKIDTKSPFILLLFMKMEFNKEGQAVFPPYDIVINNYDAAGYPTGVGEMGAVLGAEMSYTFDEKKRPAEICINIRYDGKSDNVKLVYTYTDDDNFPEVGTWTTISTDKDGKETRNTAALTYSDYATDAAGNWISRNVVNSNPENNLPATFSETRTIKYYK